MTESQGSRWRAAATVLLAGMLYGTTGTAQALAPSGASSASIGLVRIGLGGLALLPFAARKAGGFRGLFRCFDAWTLLSGLGLAGFQFLFFRGVLAAGVALGTIVAIASGPVFAGLLGAWFFRDRLPLSWWASTILAVSGCALMTLGGAASPDRLTGIGLALGAGASYALLGLGIKISSRSGGTLAATSLGLVVGALMLVPVFLLSTSSLAWILSLRGALVTVHLGLLTTAVPYFFFGRALGVIPMGWVYTLGLSEPLVASLLGFLYLRESPAPAALVGIALMTAGLTVSSLSARRG